MAKHNKKGAPVKDAGDAIESALSKTELFFQKNSNLLLYILLGIVIVVGMWFGYKYLIKHPREGRAANMIFVAEQQFAIDSFALALNGDGNNAGFLDVISKYGGTSVGNIAKHYAGVCYMRLGEYEEALNFLKKYRRVDGIPSQIINSQNIGLQGDAHAQLGEFDQAAHLYMKAAEVGANALSSPYYLKKAGTVYQKLGKADKAIEAYQTILDRYPSSMEARDVEKFIGAAEQQ